MTLLKGKLKWRRRKMNEEMNEKTELVLQLVSGVIKILIWIAVFVLIGVLYNKIDKLENKNINLELELREAEIYNELLEELYYQSDEIWELRVENAVLEEQLKMATKDGYYDAKFVETLMDDVETFTEYLIWYVKVNGNDVGFEEWLIKNDKPLYDRFMYYDDIYEKGKH